MIAMRRQDILIWVQAFCVIFYMFATVALVLLDKVAILDIIFSIPFYAATLLVSLIICSLLYFWPRKDKEKKEENNDTHNLRNLR